MIVSRAGPPPAPAAVKGGDRMDRLELDKQEQFCLNVVKGKMSDTQAYADAYNITNRESAQASASRLKQQPKVRARLETLRAEIHDEEIMDIKEGLWRLSSIGRRDLMPSSDDEDAIRPSVAEATKAIELLIKAQGGFVDKKQVEMTGAVPVIIKDDVDE